MAGNFCNDPDVRKHLGHSFLLLGLLSVTSCWGVVAATIAASVAAIFIDMRTQFLQLSRVD